MTRHNMGYLVVREFAHSLGWILKEDHHFCALIVKGIIRNQAIHLILPLTYMNLSGNAVRNYMNYFKIPSARLVVVTDDIALTFGQLRLKKKGSSGGHKGLENIAECLGTTDYPRLRMGIGHPGEKMLAHYVLETFSLQEQQELPNFIERGVEVLQRLLKDDFSHVMTSVNTVSRHQAPKQETKVESIDLTKPPSIGLGE